MRWKTEAPSWSQGRMGWPGVLMMAPKASQTHRPPCKNAHLNSIKSTFSALLLLVVYIYNKMPIILCVFGYWN